MTVDAADDTAPSADDTAASATMTVRLRKRLAPWRPAAVAGLGSWLASTIAYVVATFYAWRTTKSPAPAVRDLGSTWHHMDATYYTLIAERGYHANPDSIAFYPLYPMVVRIVDWMAPGGVLIAAAAVSSVCAYALFVLMFRLVEVEFDAKIAGRSIVFLSAFPMAFFLFGAYNESMFMLLSVATLYAARRSKFWLAGVMTCLAGATRLFGLLLAGAVAYEYLRQRDWRPSRIRWDALCFAIMPVGLVAFAVYCRISFGNWFAFFDAQKTWHREYTWPGHALYQAWQAIGTQPWLYEWHLLTVFEFSSMVLAIVLTVLGFVGPWRLRRDQYYLLVAAILPLLVISCTEVGLNRWLVSVPRYVMEYTAIFIVLARMGRSPIFEKIYLATGYMLQALMLAVFVLDVTFVA